MDCCGIDGPEDWGEFNPNYVSNEGLPSSCDCDDDDDEDVCGLPTFNFTNINNMTEMYNSSQTVWTRVCVCYNTYNIYIYIYIYLFIYLFII